MMANPELVEGLAKIDKGEIPLADAKAKARELFSAELAAVK